MVRVLVRRDRLVGCRRRDVGHVKRHRVVPFRDDDVVEVDLGLSVGATSAERANRDSMCPGAQDEFVAERRVAGATCGAVGQGTVRVEERSGGSVKLGPGSLYWALGRLADVGLIEDVARPEEETRSEERR